MKTKSSKQPKKSKPVVQLKDIKPKTNPNGGDSSTSRFNHPDLYRNVWINS